MTGKRAELLEYSRFDALADGPHLVVLGAVHGDEYCGPQAIAQAIAAIHSGGLPLECGAVTFVPVVNPRAYLQQQRFVDRNLNRHLYRDHPGEDNYEDLLTPRLCELLDTADVLLDIHSYQSSGGPFCFLGTTSQREIDYARALGVPTYIHGWGAAFGKAKTEEQRNASMGTTDYIRSNSRSGIGVTLECGHHHNAEAAEIGLAGIKRALAFLEMSPALLPPVDRQQQHCIEMKQVYYKEKPGHFVRQWQHADAIREGEVIARYEDGETVAAPEDGVIVLPKHRTDQETGSEWFYVGVEMAFPCV